MNRKTRNTKRKTKSVKRKRSPIPSKNDFYNNEVEIMSSGRGGYRR